MKNSNDTIGNRTRDLPACSAVPQPTAPTRTPHKNVSHFNYLGWGVKGALYRIISAEEPWIWHFFHLAPAVTHKSLTLFLLFYSCIKLLSMIVAVWNIGTKKKLKLYTAIVKNTSNSKGFTCLAQAFLVAPRRITTMSEPVSSKHGEGMCQQVQTTLFCR